MRDPTSDIDPDRDYLREQIRKLVELVARLLGRDPGDPETAHARDQLAAAAGQLLGHPYDVLERLAPDSVALLLGRDPERMRVYAEMVAAESRIARHTGDELLARRLDMRAQALLALAARQEV